LAEQAGDFAHDVLHRCMTDAHCLMTFVLRQNSYSLQRPIIRVNMLPAMPIIGLLDLRASLTFLTTPRLFIEISIFSFVPPSK